MPLAAVRELAWCVWQARGNAPGSPNLEVPKRPFGTLTPRALPRTARCHVTGKLKEGRFRGCNPDLHPDLYPDLYCTLPWQADNKVPGAAPRAQLLAILVLLVLPVALVTTTMAAREVGNAPSLAASDDPYYAPESINGWSMTYGFGMGIIMTSCVITALCLCRQGALSLRGAGWILGFATLTLQALWLLALGALNVADSDGPPVQVTDTLTYSYIVVTSATLLWATSQVVSAVEGGHKTMTARALWAAAGFICALDFLLTWLERGLTYNSGGPWTIDPHLYRFSNCGVGCPVIPGSSWYRNLDPLSLPCSTPQVSPVMAFIALLHGFFAMAVVARVVYRWRYSAPPAAAAVNTYALLPAGADADGDPAELHPAPTMSAVCGGTGGIWTRTVFGVPALLGSTVLAVIMQPVITVIFIGRALGTACYCMDIDLSSCNGDTLSENQTIYLVAGKACVGFLAPTILLFMYGVPACRRCRCCACCRCCECRGDKAAAAAVMDATEAAYRYR